MKCSIKEKVCLIVGKICKRLRISMLVIKALLPYSHKYVSLIDGYIESDIFMDKISPKPIGKAIKIRPIEWNTKQIYDLQIIIPAYNAEDYIRECLDSLLRQKTSFKWQAIVINDGSTDQTSKILKEYECKNCIHVITQQNKGFSGARNAGLDILQAKYVMFLDSDDYLESGAIEALMRCATEKSLEVVEGNYNKLIGNKKIQSSFFENELIDNPIQQLRGFPWGKVILAELFRNLQYPEGYWYEDSIFSFLIYPQCKYCATVSDVVYSYRRNPKGVSLGSKENPKCIDTYYIAELMIDSEYELGIDFEKVYDLLLGHISFSYSRIAYLNTEIRMCVFRKFCNLINDNFLNYHTNIPNNTILEQALRAGDFGIYELYGRLM